jgi:hypothetical protein
LAIANAIAATASAGPSTSSCGADRTLNQRDSAGLARIAVASEEASENSQSA